MNLNQLDGEHPTTTLKRLSPALASAMAAYSTASYNYTRLSLREFEAARMRTALINGCTICRGFRAARDVAEFSKAIGEDIGRHLVSRGTPPDEAFYEHILSWSEADIYSPRERVAIELAERMGLDPQSLAADAPFWTRASELYSDEEIADLVMAIGSWIAGGRVLHVLGLDTVCSADPEAALSGNP